MLLYSLGAAPWTDVQAIACALAQGKREGVILSRAQTPCVCAGGKVDFERDVDTAYCRTHEIPVFRRETRSGTICIAQQQLELQIVVPRSDRRISAVPATNCHVALVPIIGALSDLGLTSVYKAPAEVVVKGRRIAAACMSQLGDQLILAASLVLEFSPELFARALNIKDDSLRGRVQELAQRNRTSVAEEFGELPPTELLESKIARECRAYWGELKAAEPDAELKAQIRDNAAAMFDPQRGQGRERHANGWRVEIGGGTELQQCVMKAPGGMLCALSEWRDGKIVRATLSGEFFCYPPGALFRLEDALVGVGADQIERRIGEFYGKLGLVTPGIHAAHWAKVLDPKNLG